MELNEFNVAYSSTICSAYKVYGFDTGFVCYHRGWLDLRAEDMGLLWEHYLVDFVDLETLIDIVWKTKRGI